jgi:hypothetical protein
MRAQKHLEICKENAEGGHGNGVGAIFLVLLCTTAAESRREKKKRTCIWVKPKKRPRHREKNEQHGLEMDRGGIRKHAGSCQQHLPDPGEPLPLVAPGRGMHLRKMKMCASKLVFFGATRRNSIDNAREGPETMAQGP